MIDFFQIFESPLTKPSAWDVAAGLTSQIRCLISTDLAALSQRRDTVIRVDLPRLYRNRDAAARDFGLARELVVHSLYRIKLKTRRLPAAHGGVKNTSSKNNNDNNDDDDDDNKNKNKDKRALAKLELELAGLNRELIGLTVAQDKHKVLVGMLKMSRANYNAANLRLERGLAERTALAREFRLCARMLSEVERYGLVRIVEGSLYGGNELKCAKVREGLVGYVHSVLGGEGVHAAGWV